MSVCHAGPRTLSIPFGHTSGCSPSPHCVLCEGQEAYPTGKIPTVCGMALPGPLSFGWQSLLCPKEGQQGTGVRVTWR